MGEGEAIGDGTGAMHLVGEPVVDRVDAFAEDQSDTAELPPIAAILAELPADRFDRLVAPPGSGLTGWSERFRGVLNACARPLLLVAVLCAGPMVLFVGRVSDVIVAAPVLFDLAGGIGLLLLPLMWLSYLALAALPIVLCLAGVAGVLVAWAPEGTLPGVRTMLGTVGHRVGPMWAWLAVFGAVVPARALFPADAALPLTVSAALLSSALTAFLGVLGCVMLFERRRGPRRALRLLAGGPTGALAGLGVASLTLALLPSAANAAWGSYAAAPVTVGCALLWSVAALLTYAQARRAEGRLTSAQLRRELSA